MTTRRARHQVSIKQVTTRHPFDGCVEKETLAGVVRRNRVQLVGRYQWHGLHDVCIEVYGEERLFMLADAAINLIIPLNTKENIDLFNKTCNPGIDPFAE